MEIPSSGSGLALNHYNFSSTPSASLTTGNVLAPGSWNHVVGQVRGNNTQVLFLNGIRYSISAGTIVNGMVNGSALYIGVRQNSATLDTTIDLPATNIKFADLLIWKGGPALTQSQVNSIHNQGFPVPMGFTPVVRNECVLSGNTGQKLSMKATLTRTTNAVSPAILDIGAIKL